MQRLRDLPVAVELSGPLGQEVTAFVEVEAGWQVVSSSGPPDPVLVVGAQVRAGVASVVVVEGTPEPAQVRTELLAGALDVIGWPADRDRLLDAPLRIRRTAEAAPQPRSLVIAGLAGGVGTSTVTLAVAGMLAWTGRRVVVAGGDDLLCLAGLPPWSGPGTPEVAALGPADAKRELAGLLRPVAGVTGLFAIGGGGRPVTPTTRIGGGGRPVMSTAGIGGGGRSVTSAGPGGGGRPVTSTAGWPADVVVVDAGRLPAAGAADLVVARPDAALRAGVSLVHGAPVVLVGDAPLGRSVVRRLLGGLPVAAVPHAARVARAGVAGRVPSGIPGSWLAALRPAVRAVTA